MTGDFAGRDRPAFLVRSVLAAIILVEAACATTPSPPTVAQIIEMSRQNVPPYEIIQKMQASGAVYQLPASQLALLAGDSVAGSVIDYMQQTHLDAIRRDEQEQQEERRREYRRNHRNHRRDARL